MSLGESPDPGADSPNSRLLSANLAIWRDINPYALSTYSRFIAFVDCCLNRLTSGWPTPMAQGDLQSQKENYAVKA